jgi:hypothetical protein
MPHGSDWRHPRRRSHLRCSGQRRLLGDGRACAAAGRDGSRRGVESRDHRSSAWPPPAPRRCRCEADGGDRERRDGKETNLYGRRERSRRRPLRGPSRLPLPGGLELRGLRWLHELERRAGSLRPDTCFRRRANRRPTKRCRRPFRAHHGRVPGLAAHGGHGRASRRRRPRLLLSPTSRASSGHRLIGTAAPRRRSNTGAVTPSCC